MPANPPRTLEIRPADGGCGSLGLGPSDAGSPCSPPPGAPALPACLLQGAWGAGARPSRSGLAAAAWRSGRRRAGWRRRLGGAGWLAAAAAGVGVGPSGSRRAAERDPLEGGLAVPPLGGAGWRRRLGGALLRWRGLASGGDGGRGTGAGGGGCEREAGRGTGRGWKE